ncbi:MAG: oxidoreductase [Microbacterium sp.]|jgi:flavin reductase (DIM6/NTAB) family NADH-FMN oxidoreductase RutF|nr:oxidoreductase [Microbacterium sp.]
MSWDHPFADLEFSRSDDGSPRTSVPHVPDDPAALRRMFSQYPTGVAAICAHVDGEAHGMVVTSFTVGASFDPPLVLLAAQRSSRTWPLLARAERLGISVLAEANREVVSRLASRTADRFAGVAVARSAEGAVFVQNARLWLDCALREQLELGDHELAVLEVHGASSLATAEPLVYHDGRLR